MSGGVKPGLSPVAPALPASLPARTFGVLGPSPPPPLRSSANACFLRRSARSGSGDARSYSRSSLRPSVGTKSDATYRGHKIELLQRKLMCLPSAASKFRAELE